MVDTVDSATGGRCILDGWYPARVTAGRERRHDEALRSLGIPTYFPRHLEVKSRIVQHYDPIAREYREIKQSYEGRYALFPGYLFARMDDGAWARVKTGLGVGLRPLWLDFGAGPVQVPSELIAEIQSREQQGFVELVQDQELVEGEQLEIIAGPLTGWKGLLASDPARRLVTLQIIAETYSLNPTLVMNRVKVERDQVRRVS